MIPDDFLQRNKRRTELLIKLQGWPVIGDKIIFRGEGFAFHTNIAANAKKLTVGAEYEISEIEVASSWCRVKVKGFEEEFSLSFFDYESRVVSEEEKKAINSEIWNTRGRTPLETPANKD